jgi:DNA damage-binding protein 1
MRWHAHHVRAGVNSTRLTGRTLLSLRSTAPAQEGTIEERARDPNCTWMTAVEMLDDDTFLGAENSHNLIVVRKNGDAATDEERQRLDIVGEFHLGEFVNRFRRGSLVMRLPDSDLAKVPTMLFGTINGVIGIVASLPADQYAFLARLQEALCATVRGVGGLSWAAWRNFGNELRNADVRNFIDGDLIECVRRAAAAR